MNDCPKCSEELCRYGKCHACGDACDEHAEEQFERFMEAYYGGDSFACESATDRSARERREKDGRL